MTPGAINQRGTSVSQLRSVPEEYPCTKDHRIAACAQDRKPSSDEVDIWHGTDELIRSFQSEPIKTIVAPKTELDMLTCDDENCRNVGMNEIDGFMYCSLCGLTKMSVMDLAAEWRSFGGGKADGSRCGMPVNPLLPNSNMSTVIVGGGNTYMKKLHKWGSMNHKDVAKYKVFIFIHNEASRFGIPPAIINQAQTYAVQLCDKMTEADNIMRGKNRKGLIAACLHFAFKKTNCPRSIQEIARILGVTKSCVSGGINIFSEIFTDNNIILDDSATAPHELTPRFCSQLKMPVAMIDLATDVARKIKECDMFPTNVVEAQAAASIWYIVTTLKQQKKFTRKSVSDTCGISQATIVKCCKKIEETFETKTT